MPFPKPPVAVESPAPAPVEQAPVHVPTTTAVEHPMPTTTAVEHVMPTPPPVEHVMPTTTAVEHIITTSSDMVHETPAPSEVAPVVEAPPVTVTESVHVPVRFRVEWEMGWLLIEYRLRRQQHQ